MAPLFTLLFSLFLLVPVAQATQPSPISGTFTDSVTYISVQTANGNLIVAQQDVLTMAGDLSGTCVGQSTYVVHSDGSVTGKGSCLFAGTITDGSGPGTAAISYETTHAGGFFVVSNGAGGLTGVQVQGTFSSFGTYSGAAHSEP